MLCEEKDRLLEEYAIVKLPKPSLEAIPKNAVKGKKITNYGVEALVLKSAISPPLEFQHTTLEDIVLFLAKGGDQQ